MTQLAIDRGLTLIAWEAMNHWTADGTFSVHVFHKNNELAGYCSVLHAMQLLGSTGDYGRRLRAAVISFGATARGAVLGLSALGINDVTVLTQRSSAAVASPFPSVRMRIFARDPETRATLVLEGPSRARGRGAARRVRRDRQLHPAGPRRAADVRRRTRTCRPSGPATLFVDVSCDEGMGFEWARPTSLRRPDVHRRRRPALLRRRPQPVLPVELGDLGEQRGAAALPAVVAGGPTAWDADETIRRAIEIRDGRVVNPRILSFQGRRPSTRTRSWADGRR